MQNRNSDRQPWYIIPVKPGADATFRRWNLVVITILAALVLALFITAIVPRTTGSAAHHAPAKIHKAAFSAIHEMQVPA